MSHYRAYLGFDSVCRYQSTTCHTQATGLFNLNPSPRITSSGN